MITENTTIEEVLTGYPKANDIFLKYGLASCLSSSALQFIHSLVKGCALILPGAILSPQLSQTQYSQLSILWSASSISISFCLSLSPRRSESSRSLSELAS